MGSNNSRGRGAKRRIEKVVGHWNDTITNSINNVVLHTAEDSKTLVRLIVQWDAVWGAGAPTYQVTIGKEPGGTAVVGPGTGDDLDNDAPEELLLQHTGLFVSSSVEPHHVAYDLKGMRKLKPGDEIVMRHVCNNVDGVVFSGSYTLIFKE